MSVEYIPTPGIDDQAQLEIIERVWYRVAANFREAGLCMRNPNYHNLGNALDRRISALDQSDALLDAAAMFTARLGAEAIKGSEL